MRHLIAAVSWALASLLAAQGKQPRRPGVDTLVVYVFRHTDAESAANLRFFFDHGPMERDGAHYYVLIQESDRAEVSEAVSFINLFFAPRNVFLLRQKSRVCGTWGTYGALLSKMDTARYKFFVLLNSSVRGPFLPSYIPAVLPWHRLLTLQLTGEVHFLGPVLSCQALLRNDTGQRRTNPYVPSHVVVMDQAALKVLRGDRAVLNCYKDDYDAHWHSALGATLAVLEAGYNIASLMMRYKGVDWRDMSTWDCNRRVNPVGELAYDGINLHPTEVMFVPLTTAQLSGTHTLSRLAAKFDGWAQPVRSKKGHALSGKAYADSGYALSANAYADNARSVKAPSIAAMRARGSRCFDYDFYLKSNAHLLHLDHPSPADLWEHFVRTGQFELGAAHRWTCSADDNGKQVPFIGSKAALRKQ